MLVQVLFVLLAVGLVRYALSPAGVGQGADVDVAYYGAMASAALLSAIRAAIVPLQRTAWWLLSAVLLTDLIADLSSYYLGLPYPSFADVIWFISYVCMFAAVVCLVRPLAGRWNRLFTLDWVVATLTASAVGALLVIGPVESALSAGTIESVVTLAYPVFDLIVLAALAVAVAVGAGRPGPSLALIILAGTVWVVGDAIYSYQVAEGTYLEGGILDLTWPLATGLIAIAAWSPGRPADDPVGVTHRAGWLSGLCMILALGVIAPPGSSSEDPVAFYLALAALGVGGLRLILTQRENRELLRAANTDPLTAVGSRAGLNADLASIGTGPVTVAVLDLDGFKFYNDSFGHPAGDALLRRIARRLTQQLGNRGRIYRIGGDEFCVLMRGSAASASISGELKEATHVVGDGFEITASVGTADFPGEAEDPAEAIALADERMYVSKNGSRTSARSQVHEVLVRSIRAREPELAEHTGRVRMLSVEIAKRMVGEAEQLDVIERAAELHDVGKVAIPDSILLKPGPLDEDEWQLMKQHTLVGERIISASPALSPVANLVRHSHEHWDGSGYPDGLRGEEIPLGSRIILACDALDAMASQRPYSRRLSIGEALAEIRRFSGSQFDPSVTEVLISVLDEAAAEAAEDPDPGSVRERHERPPT